MPRSEAAPLWTLDLGEVGYRDAWARQLTLVDTRKVGSGIDTLLLVEHPHVITLGRRRAAEANVLAAGTVEVVEIERGGDVTYHGPGQLVAYPIVLLDERERDLHRYLRNLEEAVMRTLVGYDLEAERVAGATGVWIRRPNGDVRKICSLGIACRRWVTFHGLALNVTTDLRYFTRINPCGFEAGVMTSIAEEFGVTGRSAAAVPLMAEVKQRLSTELSICLNRRLVA